MNFRDYQWFNNPRGLRNNGPYQPIKPERYTGPRMGWARIVVGGTEHVDTVRTLVSQGCMPIISIYRERLGGAAIPNAWYDVYLYYIDAGARWFEAYEEPNTAHFWPHDADGHPAAVDWNNRQDFIAPLMDHWLTWAEHIIRLGGYPAFPAMAETVEPRLATVKWLEACLVYLNETARQRFMAVLGGGLWCATHPYVMNHFYQEPPGGPAGEQRPYYQQSAAEGGWHFEYPYDPVQQHSDPGRTIFGETAQTPYGDPNGLVATGEAFQQLMRHFFGAGHVPVVGTAGGIAPIPAPGGDPIQQDSRYQPYSRDSHAEATLAMFNWIAREGPPWLFGLALSSEADYYSPAGVAPAVELLLTAPPVKKEVPSIDPAGTVAMPVAAPGPEPAAPAPTPPPAAGEMLWPEPLAEGLAEPSPAEKEPLQPESMAGGVEQPAAAQEPAQPEAAAEVPAPPPPVVPQIAAPPLPQLLQEPPPQPSKPIRLPATNEPPAPLITPPPARPEPPAAPVQAAPLPSEPLGPGPGPLVGQPDFHWLMPAPDLPQGWFWKAARRYWSAFRPTVVPDPHYVGGVPPQKSLALTLIAPAASGDALAQRVRAQWPNVHIDLVVGDSVEALQSELDRRAHDRTPLG